MFTVIEWRYLLELHLATFGDAQRIRLRDCVDGGARISVCEA